MSELKQTYDPNRVYDAEVSKIYADDNFNCRGNFATLDVFELARSLKSEGLHEPIIIQPWKNPDGSEKIPGKEFRVVAGHRRLRAQILNGEKTIRALVKENLDETKARLLNLTENLARKDLTLIQEAKALESFAGWSAKDLAAKLGKSTGWVISRRQINELPKEIQEELEQRNLPLTLVGEIWSIPSTEMQIEFVKKYKTRLLTGGKKALSADSFKRNLKLGKHIPNREELQEFQDSCIEALGPEHPAVALFGFALGHIPPKEAHERLRDEAKKLGKWYTVPLKFQLVGHEMVA